MLKDDQTFANIVGEAADGRLLPGTIVDERFRVDGLVGQGGMCSVYEAEHLRLNRRVALKLLHAGSAFTSDGVARFQREAVLAAELKHPNIVEMYGMGMWNSRPFIAMEFLEGKTIAQTVQESGPFSERRAISILLQICDALHEAHQHHIVHRDLKPSNVILVQPGDHVKLVDFGIARLLPESGSEVQKLTQTGQVIGSFYYMSPEQCMGHGADARTDIYSFGCLMHYMLTGKNPYEAETPFEVMGKHMMGQPPEMVGVSERLNRIAAWCMRREADHRPQTIAQLKSVLEGADLSATGALDTAVTQKIKQPRKPLNKLVVAGAVTAVFVLLFGAVAYFSLNHSTPGENASTMPPTPAEQRLLLDVQRAVADRDQKQIGIANMHLANYYATLDRWDEAMSAGTASVQAFEAANEVKSVDYYWALYYLGVAKAHLGKVFSSNGEFFQLAKVLPNVPLELKTKAAVMEARRWVNFRSPHRALLYYDLALEQAEKGKNLDMLQDVRLEYALYLMNPHLSGSHARKIEELHDYSRELCRDIVKDGAHRPEDIVRVQTAKKILGPKG